MPNNKCFVGGNGQFVTMLLPPRPREAMTPDAALELAAWLVAIAEPAATKTFAEVLDEVQNT